MFIVIVVLLIVFSVGGFGYGYYVGKQDGYAVGRSFASTKICELEAELERYEHE